MAQDISFEISAAVRELDVFFCTVASEMFSTPKKIYGGDAREARKLAISFASSFHVAGTTRAGAGSIGVGAAVLGALPAAGATSVADGPLPAGEAIGLLILIGAALGAAFTVTREKAGQEGPCEKQYQRDIAVCRRAKNRSCYEQAAQRYAACLSGRPLPPLNF